MRANNKLGRKEKDQEPTDEAGPFKQKSFFPADRRV